MTRQRQPGRTPISRRSTWPLFVVLVLVAVVSACSAPIRIGRENDRLRRSNLDLQRKVEKLEKAAQLRLKQISVLERRAAVAPEIPGADVPQLVAVRFGRYSGPVDTDHNGTNDTLRIYLRTEDQHGRFIVAAGRAQLQVVAINPGSEPRIVVGQTFEPPEFDMTYRSGLTGTHYTLELPIPDSSPPNLTVSLTFTDAATGVQFRCQRAYELGPVEIASE